MNLFLVLILVAAFTWSSEAQNGARVYCGRQLAEMLATICFGSEEVKRDSGWWMLPNSVHPLGGVRGKRGPVDECCDKPCTIDELLTYC